MTGDSNNDSGAEGLHGAGEGEESLGSLQARLAEHGRKLAEAAGERANGLADAAGEQVQGLAAAADEHVAGLTGAGLGLGAAAGEHLEGARRTIGDAIDAAGDRIGFGETETAASELDLEESTRLPWLESADDDEDYDGGVDTRRVAVFVVIGLALLAAIVGGIWWSTHRNVEGEQVADGSLIKPPAEPYKTAPANPGGKTYEGTGDSSYAVSQGQNPGAHLGTDAAAPAATPSAGTVNTAQQAAQVATAAAKAAGAPAAPAAHPAAPAVTGGTGVQVGAYTSQAGAEAGWAKLEKQYAPLAGMRHRIVQGQADIGTVYRLQAVTDSDAAASSLCSAMKAQGLACQVRR